MVLLIFVTSIPSSTREIFSRAVLRAAAYEKPSDFPVRVTAAAVCARLRTFVLSCLGLDADQGTVSSIGDIRTSFFFSSYV